MEQLKLYVWVGFNPGYSDGLAFAMAASETEARELVIDARGYNPSYWGELEVHELTEKFARAVAGGD